MQFTTMLLYDVLIIVHKIFLEKISFSDKDIVAT
jgi:hypothetical protein